MSTSNHLLIYLLTSRVQKWTTTKNVEGLNCYTVWSSQTVQLEKQTVKARYSNQLNDKWVFSTFVSENEKNTVVTLTTELLLCSSVRENVWNNSKKRKKHVFWILKKTFKKTHHTLHVVWRGGKTSGVRKEKQWQYVWRPKKDGENYRTMWQPQRPRQPAKLKLSYDPQQTWPQAGRRSSWRHSDVTASNASAVLIGRKKSREYLI